MIEEEYIVITNIICKTNILWKSLQIILTTEINFFHYYYNYINYYKFFGNNNYCLYCV